MRVLFVLAFWNPTPTTQPPGSTLNPDSGTGSGTSDDRNSGAIAGGVVFVIIALAGVGVVLAVFMFWFM